MASPGFKLYRKFGRFWAKQSGNALGRLAKSAAFVPAMIIIFLFGAGILLAAAKAVENFLFGLLIIVALVFWFAFVLFAMAASGAVALASAQHGDEPERLLARCRELLEQHGFKIETSEGGVLRATRGKFGGWGPSGMVEKEGRLLPMEVSVTAEAAPPSATLRIECLGPGFFGQLSAWTAENCGAIAALDGVALGRLDGAVPITQSGVFLGGLGTTIFIALSICALVSVLTLTGISTLALPRLIEIGMYQRDADKADGIYVDVLDSNELPARTQLDRYLAAQAGSPNAPAAERFGGFGFGADEENVVLAIKQADGTYSVLLPREGAPLRAVAQAIFVTGFGEGSGMVVQNVGDRVFQRLSNQYLRGLETRLGLKRRQLVGGILFSYEEIGRRAPRYYSGSGEFTIFHRGSSVLRYRWGPNEGITVDRGSRTVPEEVIKAEWSDFSFLTLLWRPSALDTYRHEARGEPGYSHWILYLGKPGGDGWSGISLAEPLGPRQVIVDLFQSNAIAVGSVGLLLVLAFVLAYSTVVAGRIARPVLQVRDALRAISEGDYSVRVVSKRTDEIGQLQKLLNFTAEELKKRESIKELMGKYLSKQVADRIMESDSEASLAGVRREVSILFADVRGFTTYSEKHDPEQVTRSLNEYFEVMVDVIAVHEGVLDKYIGDGLMVVFGAPMAQPDHARRAVITALEMQAALQSLNLKRAQRGDEPIHIGIGVNTGLAISGNLGSIKRMEFTVIGDTVNTAARLESNAKQGQILIGKATYEKVKDLIECEPLGQITVKGKADPVDIWWLKDLRPQKA